MTYPSHRDDEPSTARKLNRKPLILFFCIALLVAIVGILWRMHLSSSLTEETEKAAVIDVVVVDVPKGPATQEIVLPGNVEAWHEAPIFARTSGYLKEWKTDIGTHVKAGDLLAEIETPEIDAQTNQAEADLKTAEANNKLAQSTAVRWTNLLKTNSVSKQDAEERSSAAAASAATVASAQANLDRLKLLEGFKMVVAPFDGVITARNTDTGALINAGSSGTGPELFHIAEVEKLRIYVQVPETYVGAITPDLTAELHFAEHPGQVFVAKYSRSADALDVSTRTLLIQLEVDNKDGNLIAGGFAEVHLKLLAPTDAVRLPANTLIFRAEGMQVATVGSDNRVILKPITVSRDFGSGVEVQSGIAAGEKIIANPPDSLVTGQEVHIVEPGKGDKAMPAAPEKAGEKAGEKAKENPDVETPHKDKAPSESPK